MSIDELIARIRSGSFSRSEAADTLARYRDELVGIRVAALNADDENAALAAILVATERALYATTKIEKDHTR